MDPERIKNIIIEQTGTSREEVEKRVQEKKDLLGPLATEEGAVVLVAVDLNVEIREPEIEKPEKKILIKDLEEGMTSVSMVDGIVMEILRVKRFERQSGSTGQMASLRIADNTGETRLVLWEEQSDPVEKGKIHKGDLLRIIRGFTRKGLYGDLELHVGRLGKVVINPPDLKPENFPKPAMESIPFTELEVGMPDVTIEGLVIEVSPARAFARPDGSQGRIATLRLTDDEEAIVRVVFWDEQAPKASRYSVGDRIQIISGYTREGSAGEVEVHVGKATQIKTLEKAFTKPTPKPVPLSEIRHRMDSFDVQGRVADVTPLRLFTRPSGETGVVADIYMTDGENWARVSLWDKHAETIGRVKPGDLIRIRNAYTREDQYGLTINVGRRAIIEINPLDIPKGLFPPLSTEPKTIKEIRPHMTGVALEATIQELGELREFQRQDGSTSSVIHFQLTDETGSIAAVAWGEKAETLSKAQSGQKISIRGAYVKISARGESELHLENNTQIKIT
ncbi:MAG: OB-fold nucleic acid binding domain-containing protein [Candidatus Jordarchaeum sp.]|uniref:OB-fold nucleic acid binding domain-containing protein n=1 Tax=Candidatus Jordarchaeum sp. TaxID=2823881 RepID=UPI00404ACE87